MKLIKTVIQPTGLKHSATVIFLHGSGDTGENLIEGIRYYLGKDLESPHIKYIFPTAPLQQYTPLNGDLSNVWFDRRSVSIEAKENRKSLANIYLSIDELLQSEIESGISAKRIVIGGFSMGGALSLHTAYHINMDIAGVFACSSFLNRDSIVYDSLISRKTSNMVLPKLLMFHGDRDMLVPISWGAETYTKLSKLGILGNFIRLNNTYHELKKNELIELQSWLEKILPSDHLQNKL